MEIFKSVIQVLNVLSALVVIVLVLLQHGKGADMGAAFGGGSAGSLFGATGSANFLSRATAVGATIFFCTLLALVKIDTNVVATSGGGVMSDVVKTAPATTSGQVPAVPVDQGKQNSIPD
ncbi:preprotein translocase subunit SecG [Chitinimonas sp. BJYL2]|uniref:preprotein translocase subunit SecG n=1 Tax=Chitinimonas sp. BJYL2 TaxID=2976696 RepID=UPI0022B4CFAA|nr:preprotein translocase subunit SecG [Chitinimonas sp. BJYL2]